MNDDVWDGAAFRERMAARAEDHDRYINEHRDRLRAGRSNGSELTHDRWLGEWWVYHRLAGRVETNARDSLVTELRHLAENAPNFPGAFDQEIAKSGYMMAIAGLLKELGAEPARLGS